MPDRLPLVLRLYQFASFAAAPVAPQLLARRLERGKEHPTRLEERRGQALDMPGHHHFSILAELEDPGTTLSRLLLRQMGFR